MLWHNGILNIPTTAKNPQANAIYKCIQPSACSSW